MMSRTDLLDTAPVGTTTATRTSWLLPASPGVSGCRVSTRFNLGAANCDQRHSTVDSGTGLKIMVSPVRIRVSPFLFCRDLQEKRREEEKPTMRALHNTERRELSEIKTRRAVEVGTFGAPSFVVGKERF
jgi:hypothetical protein